MFRDDIVHYIAPHFAQLPDMLEGLRVFGQTTLGRESLARAATLALALYIFGNGRVHRSLISDTLQRDNAIPPGVIAPISATITSMRSKASGMSGAW